MSWSIWLERRATSARRVASAAAISSAAFIPTCSTSHEETDAVTTPRIAIPPTINPTSGVCASPGTTPASGTVFELTFARFHEPSSAPTVKRSPGPIER